MQAPGGQGFGGELGSLLDGRYRVNAPVAESVLLRELRGTDVRDGSDVALWMPHRHVAPAFEDIDAEIALSRALEQPAGCRRLFARGPTVAYIVGEPADHIGPRPRRNPHTREVVAGWFRAVAGIVARNHQAGRWHGLLTCDDISILDGKLVAAGFGFWVRADPEAVAATVAEPDAAQLRALCAPEIAACAIGPAADLWALGRCTIALATGSGEGDPLVAMHRRHPELAELLALLMNDDPDARPGDLRALADAVTRALEIPYRDEGPPPKVAHRTRHGGASPVVPIFAPEPEGEDTDEAVIDPRSGIWSGASVATSIAAALAANPHLRSSTNQTTETAAPITLTDMITGPTTVRPLTGPTTPVSITAQAGRGGRPMSLASALALPTPIVVQAWSPLTPRPDQRPDSGAGHTGPTENARPPRAATPPVAPGAPARPQLQMISMKAPDSPQQRARTEPREIAKLAPPRIRSLESVLQASPRATPAALGTIAPPRQRTAPVQPARKWPITLFVVVLALAALGAAAFAVARWA